MRDAKQTNMKYRKKCLNNQKEEVREEENGDADDEILERKCTIVA